MMINLANPVQSSSLVPSVVLVTFGIILLAGCGVGGGTSTPVASGNGTTAHDGSPGPHGGRILTAQSVKFTPIAPFVKMGGAWGDRSKGGHGTFGVFPGGAKSPPHTHTGAYHAVVIRGTMTNPFGTESRPPRMGPGSYWHVPAGEQHVTACVSKESYLFYFHATGGFDFAPIKAIKRSRSVEAVAMPAKGVRFQRMAPFVKMGGAWGKRGKGSHGTFGVFKAGAASPPHTHSGAYHGVVISGVMTNPFNGEQNPPKMGSGSYWYVPGGVDHVTACVSSEPCLFYFHSSTAFDFHPTGN